MDGGTGPRGVRRHEPPCRALRFPPRKAPDLSRVPPAGRATKGERVGGVALRAGRGRPAADLMPRAATPWPPRRLRSPARPAPHAPVQVSLRAPGRPPGPGSRLAGRWKVPGGPLRDSPPQSGTGGTFTVWTVPAILGSGSSALSRPPPRRAGTWGNASSSDWRPPPRLYPRRSHRTLSSAPGPPERSPGGARRLLFCPEGCLRFGKIPPI